MGILSFLFGDSKTASSYNAARSLLVDGHCVIASRELQTYGLAVNRHNHDDQLCAQLCPRYKLQSDLVAEALHACNRNDKAAALRKLEEMDENMKLVGTLIDDINVERVKAPNGHTKETLLSTIKAYHKSIS